MEITRPVDIGAGVYEMRFPDNREAWMCGWVSVSNIIQSYTSEEKGKKHSATGLREFGGYVREGLMVDGTYAEFLQAIEDEGLVLPVEE